MFNVMDCRVHFVPSTVDAATTTALLSPASVTPESEADELRRENLISTLKRAASSKAAVKAEGKVEQEEKI